ncbi:MAG: hypothetical protein KAH98_04420, partial [Dehalococcoidia bacterium]|nr:hypothetical protein [Dehalococcoidia bacterium]
MDADQSWYKPFLGQTSSVSGKYCSYSCHGSYLAKGSCRKLLPVTVAKDLHDVAARIEAWWNTPTRH